MMRERQTVLRTALLLALVLQVLTTTDAAVTLRGEQKVWHKLTLVFDGPSGLSESNYKTFSDYRLDVTFESGSRKFVVPGYYAADGNAAETGATSGAKWHCHFAPPSTGTWTWQASFRTGKGVIYGGTGTAKAPIDGERGAFGVFPSDKRGKDNRRRGRLQYVGEHHLKWAGSGEYFLKTGADSPENLLAYGDFDNTPNFMNLRKTYTPHIRDWRTGDPTWRGGKGKGLIGAINYMSDMGMNVMSFLTMNVQGDDRNVFPYISAERRSTFDVSKLAQWEIVLEHMDHMGMYIHIKLTETENDELLKFGELSVYYRELVARFSHHLALNWNIGEENQNSLADRRTYGNLIKSLDPYNHHIVVHSKPREQNKVYEPILRDISNGIQTAYTGVSLQSSASVHQQTIEWIRKSDAAGRPWVVASDEIGPAKEGIVPDRDSRDNHRKDRVNTLYANMMAGGGGCESYFGYQFSHSDLTLEDFRSRNEWWKQSYVARTFFETYTPFWQMKSLDSVVDEGAWAFGKRGSLYVIYLQSKKSISIDLRSERNDFKVEWYDPVNGGTLKSGSVKCARKGQRSFIGVPPINSDSVALLTSGCTGRRNSALVPSSPRDPPSLSPRPPTQPETSCFSEKNGNIVIQAESTTLPRGWSLTRSVSGYSGDAFITFEGDGLQLFSSGQSLKYRVYSEKGGLFYIKPRAIRLSEFRGGGSSRSRDNNDMWIFIEGKGPTIMVSEFSDNDTWTTGAIFATGGRPEASISLPAGFSDFVIAARSSIYSVDAFILVRNGVAMTANLNPTSC